MAHSQESLWIGLFGVLLLGGCSAPLEKDGIGAIASPIVGGQETPTCAWPTTVHYRESISAQTEAGCTATLVHPQMVTIAAHCMEDSTPIEITFGELVDERKSPRRVAIESCHEKGGQAAGEDFAYCILKEAVNDVPIIPILFGCETEILKPKQDIVLVGYGNIDENTESPGGHKRWVHAPVVKRNTKTIDLGDTNHTNCFGDSGGPAYVKLDDGTWRVFGATSTSTVVNNVACAAPGTWAYLPYYVPWIEQDSGLDVTPCYDSDGTWNPGPHCQGVPTNPEVSDGTWAKMCTENLILSGPLSSCGDPFDAGLAQAPDAQADAPPESGDSGVDAHPSGAAGSGGSTGLAGSGGSVVAGTGGSATATSGTPVKGTIQTPTAHVSDVEGGCTCSFSTRPRQSRSWFALILTVAGARRRRRRWTTASKTKAPAEQLPERLRPGTVHPQPP
jgi:V8-like Glu-specific endopeptidase